MLIERQEENHMWIFKEIIIYNLRFSEFSKKQDDELEKIVMHFHPGHLQPKIIMLTRRPLVE